MVKTEAGVRCYTTRLIAGMATRVERYHDDCEYGWSAVTRQLSWPFGPMLVTAAGLLAAGIPEDFEGPTLIYFGNGHGLDLSNAAAIALLVVGISGLTWGAVRHARGVWVSARNHRVAMTSFLLVLLAGTSLLILSGTSTALILWAPGTALVVLAMLGLTATLK